MSQKKLLDEVVVEALRFLGTHGIPEFSLPPVRRRLVVGSGNALPTGRMLFRNEDAVFADEGQYLEALARASIDGAVVISASGKKHAPAIVQDLQDRRLETFLITCNGKLADAGPLDRDHVLVTPSQPEPPTYNTSTYLGMLLTRTREDPGSILEHIDRHVAPRIPSNLKGYDAFYLLVRPEYDDMRPMFITKFDELFGPRLVGRCYTFEQTKHAKTVVGSRRELFISFACQNRRFGNRSCRLEVPLPSAAGVAAMLAIGYYVVGRIQRQKPPWFLRNIDRYVKLQKKMFH